MIEIIPPPLRGEGNARMFHPQANSNLSGLYAIIDPDFRKDLTVGEMADSCLSGGAKLIQLRNKSTNTLQKMDQSREILDLKKKYNFIFIINDDPVLAKECGADGVHLGQSDMSVTKAREILGSKKIIGLSSHSLEEASEGLKQEIDYLALGAIFPTTSKPVDHPIVGLDLLKKVRPLTNKPLVAIGGITLENISDVINAGADMIAVISSLLKSDDIRSTAHKFSKKVTRPFRTNFNICYEKS